MSGEHERRCGGTFDKIKEPADYKAKENRKRTTTETTSDSQATSTQSRYERGECGTDERRTNQGLFLLSIASEEEAKNEE